MENNIIIGKTIKFVKETLSWAEWWHDFWHIMRVYNLAKRIALEEKEADVFIVELWSLLHDIADSKFHGWDEETWPQKAREFLESLEVEKNIIEHVENIVKYMSFGKKFDNFKFNSIELQIIQDADKLDALWAIWIARAFNFWWYKWNEIYNPEIKPNLNITKAEYKAKNWTTINHFYEKLLLLKNMMNTKTWKEIAEKRHKFLETFLDEFFAELEGKS